jgi:hypothetical protein
MIVADLFNKYDNLSNVWRRFCQLYPEPPPDFRSYAQSWAKLAAISPAETPLEIVIGIVDDGDGPYVAASARSNSEDFVLDFMPWAEVLGMKYVAHRDQDEIDCLCHILWEITFYGYTPTAIQQAADELTDDDLLNLGG